ncbi:hypothetical protein C2S52_005159 [Perilla frutescens var. hirtella]|nr:hypothetical protein C2S52_005159 [Perilla frutescens var. hirtella]
MGPAFSAISAAEAMKFNHRSLKEVEMTGFVGCLREEALLLELIKNAPLIERVVIDTQSEYYDDPELDSYHSILRSHGKEFARSGMWPEPGAMTRSESIERAKRFVTTCPQQIKFVVT